MLRKKYMFFTSNHLLWTCCKTAAISVLLWCLNSTSAVTHAKKAPKAHRKAMIALPGAQIFPKFWPRAKKFGTASSIWIWRMNGLAASKLALQSLSKIHARPNGLSLFLFVAFFYEHQRALFRYTALPGTISRSHRRYTNIKIFFPNRKHLHMSDFSMSNLYSIYYARPQKCKYCPWNRFL